MKLSREEYEAKRAARPDIFPDIYGAASPCHPPSDAQPEPPVRDESGKPYSDQENRILTALYKQETVDLDQIAAALGRSRWSVAMQASRLGITNGKRAKSESHKQSMSGGQKRRFQSQSERDKASAATKQWLKNNEHPRGMLGKKHSGEAKAAISEAHLGVTQSQEHIKKRLRSKLERYGTLAPPRHGVSWKSGWVEVGGQKFFARSKWEGNYARYLEWCRQRGEVASWKHEPETFWFPNIKRGCVSYLPDFLVELPDGSKEYHETKGWMDSRSKTKIRRMAKYYPHVKLVVIDAPRYAALAKTCSKIVPGWI